MIYESVIEYDELGVQESGITPTAIARRTQLAEQQVAQAGPSNTNGNVADEAARPGTRRTSSNQVRVEICKFYQLQPQY